MSDYQISTDCLHAGYRPGNGEPRNIPIMQRGAPEHPHHPVHHLPL